MDSNLTSGQLLKQRLGLSKLKYVMISRVLISTYRVYLVFYDSRKPNFPITTQRALKSEHISMIYQYPFEEAPMVLPLINLDDFNGPLYPAMFFVTDMSGEYGKKDNKLKLTKESVEKVEKQLFFGSLQEYLTLSNLKASDVVSSFTKATRAQRNIAVGSENRTAKLLDVNIDTIQDHVTFIFKTTATLPIYPEDAVFKKTDITNFSLKRNPDKEYELYIRVLDFFKWLKGTKPDAEEITVKDIKDVLSVNNIQIFSTDPSYHWQGGNWFMSQLDASIYPTDIAPQHWNSATLHGDDPVITSKHLVGLIRQMGFFHNPMASMLNKRLKDRELI